MRAAASMLGVPFVRADATRFSATGYVGGDVEDMVRGLLQAAGGDVGLAEFGIVYVDEVDKLAEVMGGGGGAGGRGVNTRDVQASMLKLMEDAEVPITAGAAGGGRGPPTAPSWVYTRGGGGAQGPTVQPPVLRTRHVLWIFSGAFAALESQVVLLSLDQLLLEVSRCRECPVHRLSQSPAPPGALEVRR